MNVAQHGTHLYVRADCCGAAGGAAAAVCFTAVLISLLLVSGCSQPPPFCPLLPQCSVSSQYEAFRFSVDRLSDEALTQCE